MFLKHFVLLLFDSCFTLLRETFERCRTRLEQDPNKSKRKGGSLAPGTGIFLFVMMAQRMAEKIHHLLDCRNEFFSATVVGGVCAEEHYKQVCVRGNDLLSCLS
ncbi:MAG: hypothetical protein JWQ27_3174 [Ferruginibacter sp.]|nr:hypothetical protein [Ferruginibacter sp.]